jgi:hypothetical protein
VMPLEIKCIASRLSCDTKAGHPVIMENLVVTGSPAFAGDDDREVNDPSEKSSLVRSAARQPRCALDGLAGALSELSEIDGRDPAALLKQRGYHHLGARDGPPFVLMLFSRSLFVRHGNTKRSPPRAPFY